jgi:hypothetical protein
MEAIDNIYPQRQCGCRTRNDLGGETHRHAKADVIDGVVRKRMGTILETMSQGDGQVLHIGLVGANADLRLTIASVAV